MPKPVGDSSAYVPGLDGIRALAVLAVLGYHLGLPHLSGGLLGVGVFFTLSGFLITRILLSSWDRTGTLELRRFWLHRARRLLPALALVLVVVLLGTALTDRGALAERWGETWSAAAYVANWHTIAAGASYFERFVGPGPLDHLWSLSVEEQFYLLWPLVLLVALRGFGARRRHLVILTAVLAAVSFLLLMVVSSPGFDHTRAYEGTDTRAGGVLVGALLAVVWERIAATAHLPDTRAAANAAGIVGLLGIGWLVVSTDDYSMQLYSYGLLLLSLCSAALIAAVALPGSTLGRLLGVAPLRWLGERSYGIYLWQLPVIAFLPADQLSSSRLAWSLTLTATTLVLAELSWRLVEDPIRRHGLVGAVRRVRAQRLRTTTGHRTVRVPLLPTGVLCVSLVGVVSLVSCHQMGVDAPAAVLSADIMDDGLPPLPPPETGPAGQLPDPPNPQGRPGPPRTSCADVVHVGESTSVGLVNPLYLPARADRIQAQLDRVGVKRVRTDIAGARSIVETWHGQPNAQEAVRSRLADGYDGCWTIAMGTNDAANQVVGGVHPYPERIDLLMKPLHGQPVMWLTVKSLEHSGPYDDEHMRAFDDALIKACDRYPNLRVYDWRSEVRDPWFISDGIHFTTPGYRERSHRIAMALARAYPLDGPPAADCVVRSGLG